MVLSESSLSLLGNISFSNFSLKNSYFLYSEASNALISSLTIDFIGQNIDLYGFFLCFDDSSLKIGEFIMSSQPKTLESLIKLEGSEFFLRDFSIFQEIYGNFIVFHRSKGIFLNSVNILTGIYIEESFLVISQSIIKNFLKSSAAFVSSRLYLLEVTMNNCDLSLILRDMIMIYIENTEFINNFDSFTIEIDNCNEILINNSIFSNNNSTHSGFLLEIHNSRQFFIRDSSFSNNSGFSSVIPY